MNIFSKVLLNVPTETFIAYNFEKSAAGTYQVTIPQTGKYQVIAVGGGGRAIVRTAGAMYYAFSGGSGACFNGVVNLAQGTYSCRVAEAAVATSADLYNTYLGDLIIAGGSYLNNAWVGGGTLTLSSNLTIISYTTKSNGNTGGGSSPTPAGSGAPSPPAGGASLYGGYGAGAGSNLSNPTGGYLKIVHIK